MFLALRELDEELTVFSRVRGRAHTPRGSLWWFILKTLCEYPWPCLLELGTKARGKFLYKNQFDNRYRFFLFFGRFLVGCSAVSAVLVSLL